VAFAKVLDGGLDASFYYGELEHPSVERLRLRASTYRVAAPAAWNSRVVDADWSEIAQQPWVITPAISTHHQLVRALFDKHGIAPTKVVEADQESVIANLVVSGVGLSLIREELALEKEAAGEVCLWREVRLETTLWFIYLMARRDDPAIRALLGVLRATWKLT
jgi:DNA-binding transcriptional LysR family regulator